MFLRWPVHAIQCRFKCSFFITFCWIFFFGWILKIIFAFHMVRSCDYYLLSVGQWAQNVLISFAYFFRSSLPFPWYFYMKFGCTLHICFQLCGDLLLASPWTRNEHVFFNFRTICGIHSVYLIKNIVAQLFVCQPLMWFTHFRLVWHS